MLAFFVVTVSPWIIWAIASVLAIIVGAILANLRSTSRARVASNIAGTVIAVLGALCGVGSRRRRD